MSDRRGRDCRDRAGVTLQVQIRRARSPCSAISTASKQVFVHVLDNAVKFTPDGGQVSVAIERHDDQAIVTIVDTGVSASSPSSLTVSGNPVSIRPISARDGSSTERVWGSRSSSAWSSCTADR